MTMPTFDPENTDSPGVFAGTDVPKANSQFVTPLEAARSIVAEQYLAAQDREDQGRTLLKAAEDHHAACLEDLNLLEDAHRVLFPESPPAPDPVTVPVAANLVPRR